MTDATIKTQVTVGLLVLLALHLAGCSTPEERHRRQLQWEKEDARWEAERRQHDRQRDADDFRFFLEDYAHRLGKAIPELTEAERAEAKREFNDEGGRHYREYDEPHYWW